MQNRLFLGILMYTGRCLLYVVLQVVLHNAKTSVVKRLSQWCVFIKLRISKCQ